MSCWRWAQLFLITLILLLLLYFSCVPLCVTLCLSNYRPGPFACTGFQPGLLPDQLLSIICQKETGPLPSAWCDHRADMSSLAPPPLLWHEPPSLALKATSGHFTISPIILVFFTILNNPLLCYRWSEIYELQPPGGSWDDLASLLGSCHVIHSVLMLAMHANVCGRGSANKTISFWVISCSVMCSGHRVWIQMDDMTAPQKWSQSILMASWWLAAI